MKTTSVDDYLDKVAEKYDKIPKPILKRVIDFGLRSYYRINLRGGDVLLKSPYFTAYTGKQFSPKRAYDFGKYKNIKRRIKYRIQYTRKKTKYSGYYYFGMTEDQYKEFKEYQKNNKKKREKIRLENVTFYKIFKELFDISFFTRFFKVEVPEEGRFAHTHEVFETNKFEYIGKKVDRKFIPVDYEKGNK